MNSVHFFSFSPFGCRSGACFGQLYPLLGTPNFFLPIYGPWPLKLLSVSGFSPKTELNYNIFLPRLIFSLKYSFLAFLGKKGHFEGHALARGKSPKVFEAGISNSICELTLPYNYKVSPENFWYVGRPTLWGVQNFFFFKAVFLHSLTCLWLESIIK